MYTVLAVRPVRVLLCDVTGVEFSVENEPYDVVRPYSTLDVASSFVVHVTVVPVCVVPVVVILDTVGGVVSDGGVTGGGVVPVYS